MAAIVQARTAASVYRLGRDQPGSVDNGEALSTH